MDIHFTARKFRVRAAVRDHATTQAKKLDKFYDGIIRCDVILGFEKTSKSLKTAEINLHVYGSVLSAKETSEDFLKSIDLAIDKVERQLAKYKTKTRLKNKKTLRRVKQESTAPITGEEE